jgi:hypothetical protein
MVGWRNAHSTADSHHVCGFGRDNLGCLALYQAFGSSNAEWPIGLHHRREITVRQPLFRCEQQAADFQNGLDGLLGFSV